MTPDEKKELHRLLIEFKHTAHRIDGGTLSGLYMRMMDCLKVVESEVDKRHAELEKRDRDDFLSLGYPPASHLDAPEGR